MIWEEGFVSIPFLSIWEFPLHSDPLLRRSSTLIPPWNRIRDTCPKKKSYNLDDLHWFKLKHATYCFRTIISFADRTWWHVETSTVSEGSCRIVFQLIRWSDRCTGPLVTVVGYCRCDGLSEIPSESVCLSICRTNLLKRIHKKQLPNRNRLRVTCRLPRWLKKCKQLTSKAKDFSCFGQADLVWADAFEFHHERNV